MSTIFDEIVSGSKKSWKVWEDDNYLAFLTPYPNTEGFTVVIPKTNNGDYVFSLEENDYIGLLNASKVVAKILERALGVPRVAMVFEGTGVPYVHTKLIPLHGELASKTDVWSNHTEFYPEYIGYITTVEGPKLSDDQLSTIQNKIVNEGQGQK